MRARWVMGRRVVLPRQGSRASAQTTLRPQEKINLPAIASTTTTTVSIAITTVTTIAAVATTTASVAATVTAAASTTAVATAAFVAS